MTQQEIEKAAQEEYSKYLTTPYSTALPDWFLQYFEEAIRSIPQKAVNYTARHIRAILKKQPKDLNIFEVELVLHVYAASKPDVFGNTNDWLDTKEILEEVMKDWTTRDNSKREAIAKQVRTRYKITQGINGMSSVR